MVVDDPATAKKLLDDDSIYYTETEVAQVTLRHRSGELFRAASRLGEAHININYAYCICSGTRPARSCIVRPATSKRLRNGSVTAPRR
jgi:hypothetical protein